MKAGCPLWYRFGDNYTHPLHSITNVEGLLKPPVRAPLTGYVKDLPSTCEETPPAWPLAALVRDYSESFLDAILEMFRTATHGGELVPFWLRYPCYGTTYHSLNELLYQSCIPLTIGGETRGKADANPGEHLIHPLAVLAVGHHLLRNHHIVNPWTRRPALLWEAMRDWWAQRLKRCFGKDDAEYFKAQFQCAGALEVDCIDFIWQLLALVHDVGFFASFLRDICNTLRPPSATQMMPVEFAVGSLSALQDCLDLELVGQRVSGLSSSRHRPFLDRYVSDLKEQVAEPYYGWFPHALYGAIILDEVRKRLCAVLGPNTCCAHVYDVIVESVSVHHFPSRSLAQENPQEGRWQWQFESNPFAYLLRVVDEIRTTRVLQEPRRSVTASGGQAKEGSANREESTRTHYRFDIQRVYPYFEITPLDAGCATRSLQVLCCEKYYEPPSCSECFQKAPQCFNQSCSKRDGDTEPPPFRVRARQDLARDAHFSVSFIPKLAGECAAV